MVMANRVGSCLMSCIESIGLAVSYMTASTFIRNTVWTHAKTQVLILLSTRSCMVGGAPVWMRNFGFSYLAKGVRRWSGLAHPSWVLHIRARIFLACQVDKIGEIFGEVGGYVLLKDPFDE